MPPRLIVAGTHSGVGKTTIATGLMAALRKRGHRVASAKVGPDFIDPGYHSVATGRSAQNLDSWICGADAMAPLAAKAAMGADLLVVEGVMGLFDGASWSPGAPPGSGASWAPGAPSGGTATTRGGTASTAEMTALLRAPTILVVDASAMSTSVAALVHGYHSFDPDVPLAGVILNRVGSPHHEELLREALGPLIERGVPVLGALHRDDALTWRDRHLGLVPVVERPAEVADAVDRLAVAITRAVDLDAIVSVAQTAPGLSVDRVGSLTETRSMVPPGGSVRIAVPGGRAFSFAYPDNVARLVEAGAEIVPFDPLVDPALPDDSAGLYAGGGFPEVYAEALSANLPLLADVRRRMERGLVTWAECGGLLWLCRSLDGHDLCGAIGADGSMTGRLSLGYRVATARSETPIAGRGTVLRGHEFHYSTVEPAGSALELAGRTGSAAAGFSSPTLMASYLHLHLGADPGPAERFVATALAHVPGRRSPADSMIRP
ncbi:MAG TPA: cobyrinate a,c-diamide synthase [Acidimicrobiales bacterium]|nr:cobyrinate a,c-diamide synthase [Acidimicrobiales bacterium]